jgi:hypothetical protein
MMVRFEILAAGESILFLLGQTLREQRHYVNGLVEIEP